MSHNYSYVFSLKNRVVGILNNVFEHHGVTIFCILQLGPRMGETLLRHLASIPVSCLHFGALMILGHPAPLPAEITDSHQTRTSLPVGNVVVRCAFDIGSGSTKLKVALVDLTQERIVSVLFEDEKKVSYKALMTEKSEISSASLASGVEAIESLKRAAWNKLTTQRAIASEKPLDCRGVAGSPFRDSTNRKYAIDYLTSKTNVPITILSQDETAVLGVLATLGTVSRSLTEEVAPLDLIVWDIGGATMQLSVLRQGARAGSMNRFIIQKETLASETFKQHLIETIQHKPAGTQSPNPISPADMMSALNYVKTFTAKMNPDIRARLRSPGARVVGIGPVLAKSVLGQTNTMEKNPLTSEKIKQTLEERLGWTDKQIGGPYADTQVSNLILVLGFMQQLQISELRVLNINLNEGVFLNEHFWASR